MPASRVTAALATLALLPLALAACGSENEPPSTPPAVETSATETEPAETEPAETEPADEVSTPAEPAATEPALGDWCAALENSADEVAEIVPDEGERVFVDPEPITSGEDAAYTSGIGCALRIGEGLEALIVRVLEHQYPDEATATESMGSWRDDTDPMIATTEDMDFGDEAVFTVYDGRMAMPPFVSFSVAIREVDRVAIVTIRDSDAELPADEASRRDQVVEIVELLER